MTESERWVRDRIVSPEQAERIRALYPAAPTAPWGMIVFSGLGAVIVGLVLFKEPATAWRMFFAALLLIGIVGLKITSPS